VSGEWEALLPGDRHTTAFWWIQMQVRRLTDEGVVNEIWAATIFGAITGMRAKANDMMSSLDRDLPCVSPLLYSVPSCRGTLPFRFTDPFRSGHRLQLSLCGVDGCVGAH
jgi:hypothetical protein